MRIQWLFLALIPLLAIACGGDPYATPTGTGGGGGGATPAGGGGGAITGILLNVQRSPSQTPFKGTLDEWKVVDSTGSVLFASKDVPSTAPGHYWTWKRSDVTGITCRRWLGTNPLELKMVKDDYSQDYKKCTYTINDADAAEVRNLSSMRDLLQKQKLVILVGKVGQ